MSILDNLFAIRIFEKDIGPLVSATKFSKEEMVHHYTKKPKQDISIEEDIRIRLIVEDMIRQAFIVKGGQPKSSYAIYFAVGVEPLDYILRNFANPAYIKIPLNYFKDRPVSFIYGNSEIAFFRKDKHETRRRVYTYHDIGGIIEEHGLNIEYDGRKSFVEMHLWDPESIQDYSKFEFNI